MLINRNKQNKGFKKQKPDNKYDDPRFLKLEGENIDLFERLESKLSKLDETELINSALKCLEHKADRIIKRQLLKKVKIMTDNGLKPQQIATRLNKKNIPSIHGSREWSSAQIASLLDNDQLHQKKMNTHHED